MPNSNGELNSLAAAGLSLPAEAVRIFSTCATSLPFTITLTLANQTIISLDFELADLDKPDHVVTKTVGATVEALLNQISIIKSVQNKK